MQKADLVIGFFVIANLLLRFASTAVAMFATFFTRFRRTSRVIFEVSAIGTSAFLSCIRTLRTFTTLIIGSHDVDPL